jgi:hypothetical protein
LHLARQSLTLIKGVQKELMDTRIKTLILLLVAIVLAQRSLGQGMQMGEVIILTTPVLKNDISPEIFKAYIHEDIVPAWNDRNQKVNFYLFQADRGNQNGQFLLVCGLDKKADRKAVLPGGNPFIEEVLSTRTSRRPSDFMNNPEIFTEYHLIGSNKIASLPYIGILGIHYIKVQPGRTRDFEKFVADKMHPAVGNILPDMHLLTYKAVDGRPKGNYITIFAIESVAARDRYWPAGKPETELLKNAFIPHQPLAQELKNYLVPGTFLEASGGAAAIFESKEWTDYVLQPVLK